MIKLEVEPIAVTADDAARLLGLPTRVFKQLVAADLVPGPTVNLGTRDLWSVAELRRWFDAGAPDRETWNQIKATLARVQAA